MNGYESRERRVVVSISARAFASLPATRPPVPSPRRRLSRARTVMNPPSRLLHAQSTPFRLRSSPKHQSISHSILGLQSVSLGDRSPSSTRASIHPTTVSRLASPRAPRTTNDSSVTSSRYPAVTPRAYGRARRRHRHRQSQCRRSVANESIRRASSFDARRVARDPSRAPVLVLVVVIFFAVLNLRHGVARARVRV